MQRHLPHSQNIANFVCVCVCVCARACERERERSRKKLSFYIWKNRVNIRKNIILCMVQFD